MYFVYQKGAKVRRTNLLHEALTDLALYVLEGGNGRDVRVDEYRGSKFVRSLRGRKA